MKKHSSSFEAALDSLKRERTQVLDQLKRLESAIASMEQVNGHPEHRPSHQKQKRRKWTPKQRRKQSEMMKKRWAERRGDA